MEWKELWLFGVAGRMKGCNVSLLNYVSSYARLAVKPIIKGGKLMYGEYSGVK